MRSSPRPKNGKVAGRNGTLSEPSRSRRTSCSGTPNTPSRPEPSVRPKRRKITDYMTRVPSDDAQTGDKQCVQGIDGARLPTNGLNTPTEGSFCSDMEGFAALSQDHPSQEPVSTPTSLKSGLDIPKYPWNNNPIAVALWVMQKIQNAKLLVSPAPTCVASSRQASGSSTPRGSGAPILSEGIGSGEKGVRENMGRRTSRKRKQLDSSTG
jgi:hypothetical protein